MLNKNLQVLMCLAQGHKAVATPRSQVKHSASELLNGPRREKTCLRWSANNTGADQPAHPRSLISAFVIHILESTICKLGTGEILIF